MYCVYVLKSNSLGKMYIGHTEDVAGRLRQHHIGESQATKSAIDWRVVYCEEFSSRSLAMKRERFLKSGDDRQVLKFKGVI